MAYLEDLASISDFNSYVRKLGELREQLLIAIAVKDTVGLNFTLESATLMNELGIETNLHGKHGHAYVAVLHMGEVLLDQLSVGNATQSELITVGDTRVNVTSAVYSRENVAQIIIDDVDYAVNNRGINIVTVDTSYHQLVDSVSFDTHVRSNTCIRAPQKRMLQLNSMERELDRIRRQVASLGKQIERLEREREVDSARTEMMLWQAMPEVPIDRTAAKRAFFQSLPQATGTMRKLQDAGLILLVKFDEICRKNGIEYWLSFGNLLGAIRSGDFIPWDDDTDVCMMRDQLAALREALKDNEDFYLDEFFSVRHTGHSNMNRCVQMHFVERNTPYSLDVFLMDYSERLTPELVQRTIDVKKQMSDESFRMVNEKTGGKAPGKVYDEDFQTLFEKHYEVICPEYGNQETRNFLMWGIDNTGGGTAERCVPYDMVFPLSTIELAGYTFPAPRQPEEYMAHIYGDIWAIPDDMFSHQHFNMTEERVRIVDEIRQKYADILTQH